jgi:hypothetical protein
VLLTWALGASANKDDCYNAFAVQLMHPMNNCLLEMLTKKDELQYNTKL